MSGVRPGLEWDLQRTREPWAGHLVDKSLTGPERGKADRNADTGKLHPGALPALLRGLRRARGQVGGTLGEGYRNWCRLIQGPCHPLRASWELTARAQRGEGRVVLDHYTFEVCKSTLHQVLVLCQMSGSREQVLSLLCVEFEQLKLNSDLWVEKSGCFCLYHPGCWMMGYQQLAFSVLVLIISRQAAKCLSSSEFYFCVVFTSLLRERTLLWMISWILLPIIFEIYLAFCQHVVSEPFFWVIGNVNVASIPPPHVCHLSVREEFWHCPDQPADSCCKVVSNFSSPSGFASMFCGTKMCICSFQVAVLESTLSCEACKNGMPTVSRLLQMP